MNKRFRGLFLMLACCLPMGATGQSTASIVDSYRAARGILNRAIEAHGGIDVLRTAETLRVEMRGVDYQRYQSRRPDPPFDTRPVSFTLMIDLPGGRLVTETQTSYVGDIPRHTGWITDNASTDYGLNFDRRTFEVRDFPTVETQTGNLFHLPQFVLLRADRARSSLRYVGRMRLSTGSEVEAIAAVIDGSLVTLGFDPSNGRLRAMLTVRGDIVQGDIAGETEFPDYQRVDGVLLPTRRIVRAGGELVQDLAFESALANYRVPDAVTAPRQGMTEVRAAQVDPVRELAESVWLITEGGVSSLAVAVADYVVVIDAPNAEPVLRRLRALAPSKPVRFVVPTHHHEDHASGIRAYAVGGATIVTTRGNRSIFARMASSAPTIGAFASTPATGALRLEVIESGKKVFSDGHRTLEIHNAGPNPHADEMLVAWIPEAGVLFQGDLIDISQDGLVTAGTNNATTKAFGEWLSTMGWQVRVHAGAHGTLRTPEQFTEILKQSVR